jgi:hypothetical protein
MLNVNTSTSKKERSDIAWFRLRIWKLKGTRGLRRRADTSYVRGDKTESHPLLKYSETKGWRQEPLKSKWPHIESKALRKILAAKKYHWTEKFRYRLIKIKCQMANGKTRIRKQKLVRGKNETVRRIERP